ncbi:MAG: hypothetical protein H6Q62_471, partial [Firmicutes bacterium]|nr:hypothetical protein [Bacillota bacterium]
MVGGDNETGDAGAGEEQGRSSSAEGCAGGQDIVDQQDMGCPQIIRPGPGKSAGQVGKPGRSDGLLTLAFSRPAAAQPAGPVRQIELARDGGCDQTRLVVAAFGQPARVERYSEHSRIADRLPPHRLDQQGGEQA